MGIPEIPDYQVHNPEIQQQLKEIGQMIHRTMQPGWGFMLMIFTFDKSNKDNEGMFYISDAERNTMIAAMEEFIRKHRMH